MEKDDEKKNTLMEKDDEKSILMEIIAIMVTAIRIIIDDQDGDENHYNGMIRA